MFSKQWLGLLAERYFHWRQSGWVLEVLELKPNRPLTVIGLGLLLSLPISYTILGKAIDWKFMVKLVWIILLWVGGVGWLDSIKIRPTQPSQAEARLWFWLGWAWQKKSAIWFQSYLPRNKNRNIFTLKFEFNCTQETKNLKVKSTNDKTLLYEQFVGHRKRQQIFGQ